MFVDLQVGALVEPLSGRRWAPEDVRRRVATRIARYRDRGLEPGDRVFLHHGNTGEFFADLLAVWSLGGCAIPVDPRLTAFEVETLARTAAPRLSLWRARPETAFESALAAQGVAVLESAADDGAAGDVPEVHVPSNLLALDRPALILFTSGTTGDPKGVVHTHRSLRARWISLRQALGLEAYRRTLCLLPTHFGHGLICNALFPWLSGQDLYVLPPFRPDLLLSLGPMIDEHGITFLSSVPTVWRLALKTARPPGGGTLRRVHCGSAPLSAYLWNGIREWAGTRDVMNTYGITETGSWVAGTTVRDFEPEDGLIGEPWGAVVKILDHSDTGEPPETSAERRAGESGYVWLNTPALMQGYLGRDDLTERVVAQGWFSTGDIGIVDERGLLYLRGREREEINKGGMKVYPGDVDAVAERYERTLDVCTFAYDDPLQGEDIGIAVVLEAADDETLRGLHEWMGRHLAKFRMPQRWYRLAEIPRTSRGKVNRAHVARACSSLEPIDMRRVTRGTGRT